MPDRWDTPEAVRSRAEDVFAACERGELAHWRVDMGRLDDVASRVVRVTRAEYPDVRAIPYHSRWRHFGVGGVDRVRAMDERMRGWAAEERLAAHVDLAVTSVLLDAGAGDRWAYRDANGGTYARSEGLAVASYDLFASGAFSSDPTRAPWRADAVGLSRVDEAALARGMQAAPTNPLLGLGGRASLLRRLGEVVASSPEHFAHPTDPALPPRLGHLGLRLRATARGGELPARTILTSLLSALGPIWPRRIAGAAGRREEAPAGDVWRHSTLGVVPLHKLSQWLAYSLCEPIEWSGVRVAGVDALTGLAEYRNGGLFVDGGVLVPVDPAALDSECDVASDRVIEWRALTVALLDRTAVLVRELLGLSASDLPLARVLEGGTWRAGRAIAAERRAGGGPPLRIRSDGTVF
jgi:hypothetical protein